MKKAGKSASRRKSNGLRVEYDFATMKGGVRGKYVRRYREGSNLVLLDEDVARVFRTETAVNRALRALVEVASTLSRRGRRNREAPL